MTGCEFATLPDPCAAFFTWQDHLHAGEYLWIDIRKKVVKSVQCGEPIGRRSLEVTPAVFAFASLWTETVNQDHSTSQVVWSYGSAPASNRLALGYLNHGRNKISRSPFHVTREDEK